MQPLREEDDAQQHRRWSAPLTLRMTASPQKHPATKTHWAESDAVVCSWTGKRRVRWDARPFSGEYRCTSFRFEADKGCASSQGAVRDMDPAAAGIGSDGSPTEAAAAGSSLQLDFGDTGRYRSLNVFNPMSKSHRSILVEFFIVFYF